MRTTPPPPPPPVSTLPAELCGKGKFLNAVQKWNFVAATCNHGSNCPQIHVWECRANLIWLQGECPPRTNCTEWKWPICTATTQTAEVERTDEMFNNDNTYFVVAVLANKTFLACRAMLWMAMAEAVTLSWRNCSSPRELIRENSLREMLKNELQVCGNNNNIPRPKNPLNCCGAVAWHSWVMYS